MVAELSWIKLNVLYMTLEFLSRFCISSSDGESSHSKFRYKNSLISTPTVTDEKKHLEKNPYIFHAGEISTEGIAFLFHFQVQNSVIANNHFSLRLPCTLDIDGIALYKKWYHDFPCFQKG